MGSNKETNNVRDEILESIHDKKKKLINVYAGPGSGKSTLIAEIIKKYLTETDYGLNNFLCLSYTNESWKELLDKIAQKCDLIMNFDHLNITTFHKYCAALINKENELDKKTNEDLKNLSRKEIEEYKKKAIDDLIEDATNELDVYHYSNGERGAINKNLLTEKKVLFLDEAQDLKEDTYRFLESLLRASKNKIKVYAFSDPDQGIFEYGGSDHKLISKLMKKGKTYELTNNYRSCEKLVEFTEKYRKASFKSPRKQDIRSANNEKGDKDAIKCIKVNENNYCNAIIQSVKSYVTEIGESNTSEIKKSYTIGVIVPKSEEAHSIFESLTHEYIDSANITVKTTGISYTSFNLCRLDEFHSLFRELYEAFLNPSTQNNKRYYYIHINILHNALSNFEKNYNTSTFYKATISFFNDFRELFKIKYEKDNPDIISDEKFFLTELKEFMNYTSKYTFDEFYNDYVEERPMKTDTLSIEINVSTIHKAKGHEYDTVFMACLEKEKEWLSHLPNKTEGVGYEKCRYVAMTRAISKLFIFNDKIENNYFDSNFIDMTDYCENSEEYVFLSPHDLTLSFNQFNKDIKYSFTQFIPYEKLSRDDTNGYSKSDDENEWSMFPDTPDWLQAGKKLKLQNVIAESENNRFVFYVENNGNNSCFVERLATQSWRCYASYKSKGNTPLPDKCEYCNFKECIPNRCFSDNSIICKIVQKFEMIRDDYLSKLDNPNKKLTKEQREDICNLFTYWCNEHLDIEIGAVIILNNISAPWIDGKKQEHDMQYYKYYSCTDDGKPYLRDIDVKSKIYDNKYYFRFRANKHIYEKDSEIIHITNGIDIIISHKEKNYLVMKEMSKLLNTDIVNFYEKTIKNRHHTKSLNYYENCIEDLKEEYKDPWNICETKVLEELRNKAFENAEKYGFSRKVILPIIKFKE